MSEDGVDRPNVETIGAGGGPRDDPHIPCHTCGTRERFTVMKRSDEWMLRYVNDRSGEWVAYCPECDPR